jgi:hypothetical protein
MNARLSPTTNNEYAGSLRDSRSKNGPDFRGGRRVRNIAKPIRRDPNIINPIALAADGKPECLII